LCKFSHRQNDWKGMMVTFIIESNYEKTIFEYWLLWVQYHVKKGFSIQNLIKNMEMFFDTEYTWCFNAHVTCWVCKNMQQIYNRVYQ
jgi:hypothetical protein